MLLVRLEFEIKLEPLRCFYIVLLLLLLLLLLRFFNLDLC